jgi:acetoin utilization deacetylase AcuC-like enzyme
MQVENRVRRVAILDLDVHQGNGTATILASDPTIFTLSVHAQDNWPFRKASSDLDVGLADATGDDAYLSALEGALRTLEHRFTADLLLFIAGADVLGGDRLGRLALTHEGIRARDRFVFDWARARGLPVAVAMGGGYCSDIAQTVSVHRSTVAIAAEFCLMQRDTSSQPPASATLSTAAPTEPAPLTGD